MKKIVIPFVIACLAFVGCQKEVDNPIASTDTSEHNDTVGALVMHLTAKQDEATKTTLDGVSAKWKNTDKLTVMYKKTGESDWSTAESEEATTSDGGATATFDATLPSADAGEQAYAFFPANNLSQDIADKAKITIASTQYPTGTDFDGDSDILISKSFTPSTSVTTQFARLGAILKIKINNATLSSEKLVSLSVEGANPLAGDVLVGLADKTVKGIENGSNTVMAEYAPANQFTVGSSNYVYLIVMPQTLANGSHLIINGQTENHTFTKDITLGQDIHLNSGHIIPLNIGITSVRDKTLSFDFTSSVTGWKLGKANGVAGDFTYTIDEIDYSFNLTKNGDGIYQTDPGAGNPFYLMINVGEMLGLPVLPGYRLSAVSIANSASCSTSAKIGIISNTTTKAFVDDEEEAQTLSTQNRTYTFTLSDSYAGKRYYLYASAKNTQLYSINLTYEVSTRTFTPSTLVMNSVTCSARTASTLTFSWDAVTNAAGYLISTDSGFSYGEPQKGTSYVWEGLEAYTEKTIYVKAYGDGVEYYTSSPASQTGKTTLAVPTDVSWTEGTKTVSWTDTNTGVGSYGSVYKYVYTLDNGDSFSDASSATTAVLSIDASATCKVKAVCISDASLSSAWTSGTICSISGGVVTGEIYHENFGSPSGNTAVGSFSGWERGGTLTQTAVTYSYSGGTSTPIRKTSPSSGYTGASGNGSLYTASGGVFTVSNINVTGANYITFSCGTQATSANTVVSYKFNTQDKASSLSATTTKTTGPGTWGLVNYTKIAVPSGSVSLTLTITINSDSRIDDLSIVATEE